MMTIETTRYSPGIRGDQANHQRSVRFDETSGYIGITALDEDDDRVTDRVLLTPKQWQALVKFVQTRDDRRGHP
jgi:hypothetical protein